MTNEPTIREKFVGSWRLISFAWRNEEGDVNSGLGDDPVGQLTYDASGTVSAQMMRRDPPRFFDDDPQKATTEEKASAWGDYFGYFGTFDVGKTGNTVTHHVEGSSFPNIVGTDQVRKYAFAANRLTLSAESPWGQVSIVWERFE